MWKLISSVMLPHVQYKNWDVVVKIEVMLTYDGAAVIATTLIVIARMTDAKKFIF
jgi:hypothetical protein